MAEGGGTLEPGADKAGRGLLDCVALRLVFSVQRRQSAGIN